MPTHVVIAAQPPTGEGPPVGVVVPGHPVVECPGLFLTDVLVPLDAYEEEHGIILTHGATGKMITQAENGKIMARRVRRLAAVTQVFGIDWTRKLPARKRSPEADAIRWAIDPVAEMFSAPCPRAIATCMMSDSKPSDGVIRTLLG